MVLAAQPAAMLVPTALCAACPYAFMGPEVAEGVQRLTLLIPMRMHAATEDQLPVPRLASVHRLACLLCLPITRLPAAWSG